MSQTKYKKLRIGSKIRILNENGTYDKWVGKTWKVTDIYKNEDENPYYDMGVYPEKLVECEDLPVALYEWEFEVV